MKASRTLLGIVAAALTMGASSPNPSIERIEKGLRPPVLIEGDKTWTLEERMRLFHVPGLSVAVFRDFQISWAKAYGFADEAAGMKATDATLFQAGSVSKPVAAMGALEARRGRQALARQGHQRVPQGLEDPGERPDEEDAGDARDAALPHRRPDGPRVSRLRGRREGADGDRGPRRRGPGQFGADPRGPCARHAVPVLGRRIHDRAARDDGRDGPVVSAPARGAGVEAARDDAEHVRPAASRDARSEGGRGLFRRRQGSSRQAPRVPRDGRRGALDDAVGPRALRDRAAEHPARKARPDLEGHGRAHDDGRARRLRPRARGGRQGRRVLFARRRRRGVPDALHRAQDEGLRRGDHGQLGRGLQGDARAAARDRRRVRLGRLSGGARANGAADGRAAGRGGRAVQARLGRGARRDAEGRCPRVPGDVRRAVHPRARLSHRLRAPGRGHALHPVEQLGARSIRAACRARSLRG